MNDELLITINKNKEPYEKIITNDKIINITGESGSGKSTYTKKFLTDDNYIVIDTDEIIGNRPTDNKYCLEIRKYLIEKYEDNIPNIYTGFNLIYKDILEYYKDTDKYLIIDSAQFRNLDVNLLKGKIIIIRTCVDECYNRCINRWKSIKKDYNEEELNTYKERKKAMYEWHKKLNEFIIKVDQL